jgi:predicted nucleic acid-binding protein
VSLVIDASVAIKWVLDEPGSDAAAALRDENLIAPELWLVEVANVLWRRARRGEMSGEEARARLVSLRGAPVEAAPIERDLLAAADLANALDHPVYDCLYLAMAIREETEVITADKRFFSAVAASPMLTGRVRLLGD